MEEIDLPKLIHSLWKNKVLYERALELAEKSMTNIEYIPALNEVLEEIKQVNKEFIEQKIKEL